MLQTDPDPVGRSAVAVDQGPPHRRAADRIELRARHLHPLRATRSPQETVNFVDQTANQALADHPAGSAHRDEPASPPCDDLIDGAGRQTSSRRRPSRVKAAYDVAPTATSRTSTINPRRQRHQPRSSATGPARSRSASRDARSDQRVDEPAAGHHRHAVGAGRGRRRACCATSTSNRILLTYLAILFVGLFLTIRLRSLVRSLLSLVPVLIAVGAASLDRLRRSTSS